MSEKKVYHGPPFDILPEQAPEWADEDIEMFLEALEQQGRLQGRDRAIELLAEQGRGPAADEAKFFVESAGLFDFEGSTAKEIDAWVDGDKKKAQVALDYEQSRTAPREGLMKKLNKVLES